MAAQVARTCQNAAIIEGIRTEVFCSGSQERIFVIVSRIEKVGTLVSVGQVSVNKISPKESSFKREAQTFNSRILMGSDEEIWHVYAKQIGALITEHASSSFGYWPQETFTADTTADSA